MNAHVENGRVVVDPVRELPPPTAEILRQPVEIRELGDGRVKLADATGEVLGQFANRALAESTVQFLSR